MRRLVGAWLIATLALSASAAPVPKEVKRKSDEQLLEGTWEIVSFDTTGKGPDPLTPAFSTFRFTYAAGVLNTGTATSPGWKHVAVTLDPTATPKVMELQAARGLVMRNIYQLDGDTLKWCEWQKADPPDSFDGGNGKSSFVLRRVKE